MRDDSRHPAGRGLTDAPSQGVDTTVGGVSTADRRVAAAIDEALRAILPAEIAVCARRFDVHAVPVVVPAAVRSSAPRRRAEFVAGRACAADALRACGVADPPVIGVGLNGSPEWPSGFVGSITHGHGIAAAAVGRTAHAQGLGIDLEGVLAPERAAPLAPLVATAGELGASREVYADAGRAFTVVFAAKEALYKCLAPRVGRYFDFLDAEVVGVSPEALDLALRVDLGAGFTAGAALRARVALREGFALAAVLLPAVT